MIGTILWILLESASLMQLIKLKLTQHNSYIISKPNLNKSKKLCTIKLNVSNKYLK